MKPLFRLTIGPVKEFGLKLLKKNVRLIKKNYPEADVVVCFNQIDPALLNVDVDKINQLDYVNSLPYYPKAETWKLYPPRLRMESHEIILDNDILFFKRIPEIDEFLSSNRSLLFEGRFREYGKYDHLIPKSITKESICQKYGCNFLLRDKRLCDNDTPLNDFVQGICEQVEGQDDIAWCQVIDPLFNDYEIVFKTWEECKNDFDSLIVLYPIKKYLLNSMHLPMNFGFGHWHVKSQNLPEFYEMTFTLSILKREWIKKCGYHIGSKPKWFYAKNNHIDIDTMEEFELAQLIYSHQNK